MKKILSFSLTLCIVLTVFAIAPSMKAGAVAYKWDGTEQNTAKYVLDPGHGGTDPGAWHEATGRLEKTDNLNASIQIAKYIEMGGGTVSLTRADDATHSLATKYAAVNGVNGVETFVCVHRNAANKVATGLETLYKDNGSNAAKNLALAKRLQDKMLPASKMVDRGLKIRNDLAMLNGTEGKLGGSALIELGFIDTVKDNELFDENFYAICLAVAEAMMDKEIGAAMRTPEITVAPSVDWNTPLDVSWNAIGTTLSGVVSYDYKVVKWDGEVGCTNQTVVMEGNTTSTNFTIPAQITGKYYTVSVKARHGDQPADTATKTVMLGSYTAPAPGSRFISVSEINGSQSVYGSYIWTSAATSNFAANKNWVAVLCSPNPDGTYNVDEVYPPGPKDVKITGDNILIAIHSSVDGYEYAAALKENDTVIVEGIYFKTNFTSGTPIYVLLDGETIPPVLDITSIDDKVVKTGNLFKCFVYSATAADILACFAEDGLQIMNLEGKAADDADIVGTGFIVTNGEDSYRLAIIGDLNGDGKADAIDASLVLQADAKLISLTTFEEAAGTINSGAEINAVAASLILQYDANLITEFPE